MIRLAQGALTRAAAISDAVGAIHFPPAVAAAERAWRTLAAEEDAALVPIGPALHDLRFRAVTSANEERIFTVTLRTVWKAGIPHDRWTLDLTAAPLPEPVIEAIENGQYPEGLSQLRPIFPSLSISTNGTQLTIDRDAWSSDPRELWEPIDAIISWVLGMRGERRTNLPYR